MNVASLARVHDVAERESNPGRLLSLDAYRGLVMWLMVSRVGLGSAERHPSAAPLLQQLDHVEWEGMTLWDLVQPAFLFVVGVAIPLAVRRRLDGGASRNDVFLHVLRRALILVVLSQILYSVATKELTFQLINVLSQIALTSVLTFLILQLSFRHQVVAAVALLLGPWALFVLFPGADGPFSRDQNVGAVIDRAILGWNYPGYYVTINFIGSTATTLFGAWAGLLLLEKRPAASTAKILAGAAGAAFAGGLVLQPFNPMVKRLWTTSFTLVSAGWVLLALLAFYWLAEVRRYRRLAFPFAVVGMNSIFIYCVSMLLQGGLFESLRLFTTPLRHLGALAPGIASAVLASAVYWYLCYWLYERKIFFRV